MSRAAALQLVGNGQALQIERHYSIKEIAELIAVDESTARRMLQDYPGVVVFGKEGRRDGKRDYTTIRVPGSVLKQFLAERTRR